MGAVTVCPPGSSDPDDDIEAAFVVCEACEVPLGTGERFTCGDCGP